MKRSYLTDYPCGPDTHRACPADNVALFRPNSVTITPDGKVYLPPGVPLVDQPHHLSRRCQQAVAGSGTSMT